jgi:hypothetical protein
MKFSQADIDDLAGRIAESEQHLAQQRARIERQREAGEPTEASERVVRLNEATVALIKKNLAAMRADNNFEN